MIDIGDEADDIDLSSAFHAIRAVVPEMKTRKWGRILNVASAHGLVASPFKSAYVAAKHGLVGLTKTVALETAELASRPTPFARATRSRRWCRSRSPRRLGPAASRRSKSSRDVRQHAHPTRQFVTTGQIGALAVLLCSDAAASMTGVVLPIEGGWTAQ